MLSLHKYLYLKVLVTIVISNAKTIVYVEMLNAKGLVNSYEATFDTKYLSSDMYEYIVSFTKETPYFYISILDNSFSQGVIPTCSKQKTAYFYDLSASEYKCFDDKWTYYTAKSDVYAIEKVYEKIGVDFIFSPFLVLAHFFKDKIKDHLAMFILIEEDSICLSIFKEEALLFGVYIDIKIEASTEELLIDDTEMDLEEIDLDEEKSIDLDDLDTIDDIDDFGDIADLDSIEEIEEFSESKDVEEELAQAEDTQEHPVEESNGLNQDYQRFVLVQSAVNDFYKK
ncbi:MAG: hypothetical protein Q9M43_00820 [Sulfurimonas sp.]|nr:hypothetical protein [Sulfurimonas sp.]